MDAAKKREHRQDVAETHSADSVRTVKPEDCIEASDMKVKAALEEILAEIPRTLDILAKS